MKEHAARAFTAASDWLHELNVLVKGKSLYLNADLKLAEPLKLDKFAGHSDYRTNVYEFLKLYEMISQGFTKEQKAHFLYNNYLEDDIKVNVRHIRDDYHKMKKLLVIKFGDVNKLLSHKKNILRELPSVSVGSPKAEKLRYIKGFCEILDQIQSLVDLNDKDYPSMSNEIFSHSNVMSLSTLLPEFLYYKFSDKYVIACGTYEAEHIPGKESFLLLVHMMKKEQSSLEFSIEYYGARVDTADRPAESDSEDG